MFNLEFPITDFSHTNSTCEIVVWRYTEQKALPHSCGANFRT
jgi:hypothetical protein